MDLNSDSVVARLVTSLLIVFVIRSYYAQHTQEMGRLSEDIMAIFGVKPSDQQNSVEDSPMFSAPVGMLMVNLLPCDSNTCCIVPTVLIFSKMNKK